ncbi:MAG: RNA methyltransferase [Oscillospiraceae bacterium]|nr:RNA methyltransferase [Oscillospiraceae bacterium]
MAERITSRANPLMTHIRKLAASRSYRYETGEYLGDGAKLLEEAVRWGAALTVVVYTPETALPSVAENVRKVEVPSDVMRSISPMETPQGVLFLARIPDLTAPEALPGRRYLALEGVQDPGNVGTILRTADAYEADGLILLPGCADLYSHKTVRSSMGAVFRLPVWSCTLSRLRSLAERSGLPLLGAALREDTIDIRKAALRRSVILLGSEGRGLSEAALSACGQTVRIPMAGRCESLNVAAAAATLLWEGYR